MTEEEEDLIETIRRQKFESFQAWVMNATKELTDHPLYDGSTFRAICFDTEGHLLRCGGDFQKAARKELFPVHWIWPDQAIDLAHFAMRRS